MKTGSFDQLLDHNSEAENPITFKQYYWMDSEFAAGPDAPILFHICGEGAVDQSYMLSDSSIEFAKILGAQVVFLEHRYYGKSQPFLDLSSDHLKYLTLNNVIEDLAVFQKWLTAKEKLKGKWIAMGGSYAGTIAAYYRYKHPELVVGSLASSALMHLFSDIEPWNEPDLFGARNIEISKNYTIGFRQFTFEECTILGGTGYAWAGRPDLNNMLAPSAEVCKDFYGVTKPVEVDAFNSVFFDPFVTDSPDSASNILFTNGTNDSFSFVGIRPDNNKNPRINTFLITDGSHHSDLGTQTSDDPVASKSIDDAYSMFLELAKKWLSE